MTPAFSVPAVSHAEPAPRVEPAPAMDDFSWSEALRVWMQGQFASGRSDVLSEATPTFERTVIEAALAATRGQRQEAAKRLGWGRNTLTRKIKELGME